MVCQQLRIQTKKPTGETFGYIFVTTVLFPYSKYYWSVVIFHNAIFPYKIEFAYGNIPAHDEYLNSVYNLRR